MIQPQHAEETHTCDAGEDCVDLQDDEKTPPEQDLEEEPIATSCFCRECLESLKIPTMWCSPACADENFQRHREEVHMPARKRLNFIVTDRDRLEYFPPADGNPDEKTRYRPKDISEHIIPFGEATKRWEAETHIKMQKMEKPDWDL